MKKVQIVADSTCDLSQELIEKYNIAIIPLCIIMDDKSYFDGVEVTPTEIFEWANKNKTTPKRLPLPLQKPKNSSSLLWIMAMISSSLAFPQK